MKNIKKEKEFNSFEKTIKNLLYNPYEAKLHLNNNLINLVHIKNEDITFSFLMKYINSKILKDYKDIFNIYGNILMLLYREKPTKLRYLEMIIDNINYIDINVRERRYFNSTFLMEMVSITSNYSDVRTRIIQKILKFEDLDINARNRVNCNALYNVISHGNMDFFNLFISHPDLDYDFSKIEGCYVINIIKIMRQIDHLIKL